MSNSKSSSTVSLLTTSRSSSSKNYQQAFGKLSSSFGFGGSVVSAPILSTPSQNQRQKQKSQPLKTATAPAAKEDSRAAAQQAQAAYWASQSHKNFEAAYGKLSGTYGFGGAVPSPKARKV